MPNNDKLTNLEFPLAGVNLETEFQEQPPSTTPSAQNVRSLNPDTLRMRGGSRAGLTRYIQDRVPADPEQSLLIQHLNVIVDPQAEALGQNFIIPDDDWIADPSNPGTFIPPGGWGYPGGARFGGSAVLEAIGEMEAEGEVPAPSSFSISGSLIAGIAGPFTGTYEIDCGGSEEGTQNIDVGQPFTFTFLTSQASIQLTIVEAAPLGAIALTVGSGGGTIILEGTFDGINVDGDETGYVFETRNI